MEELEDYSPTRIKGKIILVTGGTTGIGRSVARILGGLGAKVFITGRNQEPLDETVSDTKKLYPDAAISGITSDLSDEKGINAVFSALEKEYGEIDILINNAGLSAEGMTKGNYDEWEYVLHTNLLNYMACSNIAAEKMKKKKQGHIINIGSMSAETKKPESTVYVATKSGIRGFSGSLRKELNPLGIKVTLLEPGLTTSDMIPGGSIEHQKKIAALEMLEAEDISASIIFCLCQPQRCDIVSMQVRPLNELI
jgi:NADP-dependent 3-hydroxy acid dehydrogenase YdfG